MLLMLAMLLAYGSANAQSEVDESWSYVTENDNYKVFINKDSTKAIDGKENTFDIWLLMVCKTECNDGYKSIARSMQNWNLYCESGMFNVPTIIDIYTDDDRNVYTNDVLSPPIAGSPSEALMNYFCNVKKEESDPSSDQKQ